MYFHQIDRILYCVLDVFILVYYMKGVLSFNTYVLGVLLLKEVLIKRIQFLEQFYTYSIEKFYKGASFELHNILIQIKSGFAQNP